MGAATTTGQAAAGPAKPLPPDVQKAFAKVSEISSLPEITTKIVQVVEDPRSTARDMHDLIRNDPALAAKMLKVVNSAFYGLPSQIASLDRAILMLGLSAVKNIALAASLSRLFKADAVSEQFAARDLWRHCVAVGVAARQIATAARSEHADEAFVAGLVHDMGLLIAQQLFPDRVRDVVDVCFGEPRDFRTVEDEIIGVDHQVLGDALAAKWKFPLGLRTAICAHHTPLSAPPEMQKTVATVHIADILCSQGRFGFWLTAQSEEISDELLALVGVTREQLDEVTADLPERVEEAERVFTE